MVRIAKILKATLVLTFSRHCETARRFVDSSTEYLPLQVKNLSVAKEMVKSMAVEAQAAREANGLLIMQNGEGTCLEKIKYLVFSWNNIHSLSTHPLPTTITPTFQISSRWDAAVLSNSRAQISPGWDLLVSGPWRAPRGMFHFRFLTIFPLRRITLWYCPFQKCWLTKTNLGRKNKSAARCKLTTVAHQLIE